ncbi:MULTISPECIES: beta strand repeat-containing protein [Pseudanabaena]|uniref:DUF7925 domain-containing protein n=2 Tax=Pseudanabaena TaxID=1152 RepID=L8N1V2_9CYAN|nr:MULTISPECIES: hypothetical protein [Pseudanabaena]ELS33686.1 hypothetical protein Pse7429DRAFT_0626 [Pseudanabaena biceps PCC 7429]MDG3494126.1 hypothetical protein [Pseudanabaena catenata USMAC16]
MPKYSKQINPLASYYRLIAATLTIGGISLLTPLTTLAQSVPQTAAGTAIQNTATGTYEDPNNPGSPINTTSNTVTVTVAEVAGITVTGSGFTNQTTPGGPVQPGNVLVFTYTVTNVGNDFTRFQIPNVSTTTGPATVSGVLPVDKTGATPASGQLQYSTDGGATWTNVPVAGLTTAGIAPNGTVLVRVPVTVQAGANAGDVITDRLGQTPGDAQNQPRIADGGDIYTVAPTPDPNGPSVNGVREASATQTTTVNSTAKTRALATILKTQTAYSNAGTPATLTDDLLTYGLSLRVESNDVTSTGISPAGLAGTSISLDGSTVTRILVSDAIPAKTVLNVAPTPPAGWIVVYTTTPVTTNADAATWTTTAPTLSSVTRVGFVNNPALITSVATGATVTGFNIQVKTTGATASPTTIYNIAQVAGTTVGDPTTKIYDDSGDQNPDNFNPGTSTFPTTPDGGFYSGTPTPTNIDTGNNNTGTNNPLGNVNATTITTPVASSVLNGPSAAPAAVGPTSNNDDFTNQSALIPPNTAPGTTIDPAPVSFTNTVQNSGTTAGNISLIPTKPATTTDLPNGTVVTVSYQGISASYTYNSTTGIFTFTSGVGTVGGNPIGATNPVQIPAAAVPANGAGSANYGVSVDLPSGTPLSTDGSAQGAGITTVQRGFPVPITAFVDANGSGSPTAQVQNITIDRVYTGFLQLVKQSRVLQGTGPAVSGTDGTFSTTAKKPAPGNIIEYQIVYTNISDLAAGTGNVVLNAGKVVITEDGVTAPNNWAKDNDANGQIDTSNIVGSAKDSGASTISFFSGTAGTTSSGDQTGTTATTDVTKYIDSVTGTVAPGISRTFNFQRKVN